MKLIYNLSVQVNAGQLTYTSPLCLQDGLWTPAQMDKLFQSLKLITVHTKPQ